MKCPVCLISFSESLNARCPQCEFDTSSSDSQDAEKILSARAAFKDRVASYAPEKRVTRWDIVKPWISVVLGFLLFVLWLKACSNAWPG